MQKISLYAEDIMLDALDGRINPEIGVEDENMKAPTIFRAGYLEGWFNRVERWR